MVSDLQALVSAPHNISGAHWEHAVALIPKEQPQTFTHHRKRDVVPGYFLLTEQRDIQGLVTGSEIADWFVTQDAAPACG